MRRRLFNIAAALSLLVCIVAVSLWVRGHFVADAVVWQRLSGPSEQPTFQELHLDSEKGHFLLLLSQYRSEPWGDQGVPEPLKYHRMSTDNSGNYWLAFYTGNPLPSIFNRVGFCYISRPDPPNGYSTLPAAASLR